MGLAETQKQHTPMQSDFEVEQVGYGEKGPILQVKLKEAQKFDMDKPRYDLLPPELMEQTAKILTFGAQKYAVRNWELGMDWSRVFGALQRHMWAWWGGEDLDPETGESHLAHACCCIAFLTAYEQRKVGTDDRPKEE